MRLASKSMRAPPRDALETGSSQAGDMQERFYTPTPCPFARALTPTTRFRTNFSQT